MLKTILSLIFFGFIAVVMLLGNTGCANIVPPTGGLRDSLAPRLLQISPRDSTRNFKERRVTFTFDEFIDVQNAQQELLVSPLMKQSPTIEYKLKTLTLKFKDSTLEENTTYNIDFGNAIKDVNESNILKNFKYLFTTGETIDSLKLRGKVIMAETGKIDSTLIVMLHSSDDDSAVIKEKPAYIARLNGKGEFHFSNLPAKTYHIFALKDESRTYRYQNEKQFFGFLDSTINTATHNNPIQLFAYANNAIDQTNKKKSVNSSTKPEDRRLRIALNLLNGKQDLLKNFVMNFETPLRNFDSTKLSLFTDSTYQPVIGYKFETDSLNKSITMINKWAEKTAYHLIIDKEFAEDTLGKKLLKSDTISFTTKSYVEYGKVIIKFTKLNLAKNPVLLFVLGDKVEESFPLSSANFIRDVFLPGDYDIRILYDDNKNGSWDPGVFFGKHQQPELVQPIERKFNIKPNWENEFEIAL